MNIIDLSTGRPVDEPAQLPSHFDLFPAVGPRGPRHDDIVEVIVVAPRKAIRAVLPAAKAARTQSIEDLRGWNARKVIDFKTRLPRSSASAIGLSKIDCGPEPGASGTLWALDFQVVRHRLGDVLAALKRAEIGRRVWDDGDFEDEEVG